jgi:probable phosphoglycerate mutase
LSPRLAGRSFAAVLVSPLIRAQRTAALAGLAAELDPDLVEWDYGAVEGRTTAEIRAELADPAWTIWRDPIRPGDTPGEQAEDVAERAARVVRRCDPYLRAGADCALVAHGHLLRILTATWLGLPAVAARLFALDAGSMSTLGYEHEQPVIRTWNTR